MEHRCGTRHQVDIAVEATSHGGAMTSVGWLNDISLSGGFLVCRLPVLPHSRVSLQVIDADGSFGPKLEARVIRHAPNGVGIEWEEYAPELVRNLESFFYHPTVTQAEVGAISQPAPRSTARK
jgi:hypothetical protein